MHICEARLYISKCTHNPHLVACGKRVPSNYKHCKLGTKNSLIFRSAAANIVSLLKYAVLPAGSAVIVEYIASFNPTHILWNVRERSRDLRRTPGLGPSAGLRDFPEVSQSDCFYEHN